MGLADSAAGESKLWKFFVSLASGQHRVKMSLAQ